jgi:hypothetical protein
MEMGVNFNPIFLFFYITWFIIWFIYLNRDENKDICYLRTNEIFINIYNAAIGVVSVVMIIILNILIVRAFVVKKTKSKHLSTRNRNNNRKEDNAIKRIIAISVNVIICWGFYIIVWSVYKICRKCVPKQLNTFSSLFNYSVAVINPIILLVLNQNYRAVLLKKFNINCYKSFFNSE